MIKFPFKCLGMGRRNCTIWWKVTEIYDTERNLINDMTILGTLPIEPNCISGIFQQPVMDIVAIRFYYQSVMHVRIYSRLTDSQWETLFCHDVSHWLGAIPALHVIRAFLDYINTVQTWQTKWLKPFFYVMVLGSGNNNERVTDSWRSPIVVKHSQTPRPRCDHDNMPPVSHWAFVVVFPKTFGHTKARRLTFIHSQDIICRTHIFGACVVQRLNSSS